MTGLEVRAVFMPYCIQRLADGRYIVLNRRYKPLGSRAKEWVEYETDPSVVALKITPAIAGTLSWEGRDAVDCIFLYSDSCVPTDGAAHWSAYADRLAVLSKLKVQGT